jgi:hypothetical protein
MTFPNSLDIMPFPVNVAEPIFPAINKPIARNPVGYIRGLNVTLNATTPNTSLTMSEGACSDILNNIDMVIRDTITFPAGVFTRTSLVIDCTTVGVNGLDTGALAASTFYYVYVIGDSNGFNKPAALVSTKCIYPDLAFNPANVLPILPYGYDSFRLVDVKVTDGSSHFLLSYTFGDYGYRKFVYDAPLTTGSSALTASYVALPLTACVAPIGKTDVNFTVDYTPFTAGNVLYVQPTGSTGNEARMSGVVAAVHQWADLSSLAFLNVGGVASVSIKATGTTPTSDTAVIYVKSFGYCV